MIWLCATIILFAIVYAILILQISSSWTLDDNNVMSTTEELSFISIVICVRNEAFNIQSCIQSILENDYPKDLSEIIIVNDHSEDNTLNIVKSINSKQVRVVNLSIEQKGKKQGLHAGIKLSKGEIILCTDGDCVVPKNWIRNFANQIISGKYHFITSIVLPSGRENLLQKFQVFDFMLTMAITHFGIDKKHFYIANGANMGFLKSFFLSVNGFESNIQLASGDDVFLVQKASKINPSKVGFLKSKSNIVYTKPEVSWPTLWMQRLRWSGKMSAIKDLKLSLLPGFIFIFHVMILISFVCIPMTGNFWLPLILLLAKMLVDYLIINKLSRYYEMDFQLKDFFMSFFIYAYYIIIAAINAVFPRSIHWKGRKTSR